MVFCALIKHAIQRSTQIMCLYPLTLLPDACNHHFGREQSVNCIQFGECESHQCCLVAMNLLWYMVNLAAAIVRCSPLWFRDALCSCKQSSLTVFFRVFPPTFVSRAYIPPTCKLAVEKTFSLACMCAACCTLHLKKYCHSIKPPF